MVNRNQVFIKIVLIFVAEAIAMSFNLWLNENIYTFKYPVAANVILGALLAVLVVALYNQLLLKRKIIVERELTELSRVILRKLPDDEDDLRRR
jgi:uncharacterized membrane protein YccC